MTSDPPPLPTMAVTSTSHFSVFGGPAALWNVMFEIIDSLPCLISLFGDAPFRLS